MTIRTHYDNLHVTPDADAQTIRQAYRRLSKQYHPDLNTDPDAHRIMQLINQAYEVLSDPQKRAEHDQWIAQQRAAERLKAQVQAMQQQYAAAQKQPAQYPPVPTAPAAAPPVPPHKTGLVILFSGLCLLLMVGLGLLIWDRQDDSKTANRPAAPAASATAETPVFGHMGQPAAGTANASDAAAASLAQINYIRPFAAPNGNPFPDRAAYIDGYPQHIGQGNYRIFVENIRNSSDVFAQLFAENGTEPLRSFFIPERGQFELPQLNAGRYQIRYRQLDGGEHVNSETIVLQGKQQEVTVYLQRGRAPVTY